MSFLFTAPFRPPPDLDVRWKSEFIMKISLNEINSLKEFIGKDRDVYPDWYIDYLMEPWVDSFVPEIANHLDEIVENQLFRKLVIKNFNINDDILVIGANRVGRQAMIISGDHDNIHIFKIINRNYFGSIDVENSKISEIYTSILWSDFKNEVIKRPLINRFDYNERKKTWWKFW